MCIFGTHMWRGMYLNSNTTYTWMLHSNIQGTRFSASAFCSRSCLGAMADSLPQAVLCFKTAKSHRVMQATCPTLA